MKRKSQRVSSKKTTNKLYIIIPIILTLIIGLSWTYTKIDNNTNRSKSKEIILENNLNTYSSSKLGINFEYPNELSVFEKETIWDEVFNTNVSEISVGNFKNLVIFSKYENVSLELGKNIYTNQAKNKVNDGYTYIQDYINKVIDNPEQKTRNQEALNLLKKKISSGEYNKFKEENYKNFPSLSGSMVTGYHEALSNNYQLSKIILVEINDGLLVINYQNGNDNQILDSLKISLE